MGGAAAALRDVRAGLGRATSFEVVAGPGGARPARRSWSTGPVSSSAGPAADVLEQAAGAPVRAGPPRLGHAQSTWADRPPERLAASVGVDPAAMLVGGQAVRRPRGRARGRGRPPGRPPPASTPGRPGRQGTVGTATGAGGEDGGRALEAGAEVATATHHLVAGAEARIEAAGRLATTADDPAVRAAAGRVAQSAAARPPMHGTMLGLLPLVAPVWTSPPR